MDLEVAKSLPNVFGNADIFGRTTNAGRVTAQYASSQAKKATLIRKKLSYRDQ